jgi:hypothetical protein
VDEAVESQIVVTTAKADEPEFWTVRVSRVFPENRNVNLVRRTVCPARRAHGCPTAKVLRAKPPATGESDRALIEIDRF